MSGKHLQTAVFVRKALPQKQKALLSATVRTTEYPSAALCEVRTLTVES